MFRPRAHWGVFILACSASPPPPAVVVATTTAIRRFSKTTACFVKPYAAARSSGLGIMTKGRMTTSIHPKMAVDDDDNNNNKNNGFPMLDKTLVSVQSCIDAYKESQTKKKQIGLQFVDASYWHKENLNGRAMYEEGPRIPGSHFVGVNEFSPSKEMFPDLNPKGLPSMLPSKELFAAAMDSLGIQNSDHIVIYGRKGCIWTPRTWFLFKTMGHDPSKLHIMQGSFEEWMEHPDGIIEEGLGKVLDMTTFSQVEKKEPFNYKVFQDSTNIVNMADVLNALDDDQTFILDSRGSSYAKGHMPNSIHIPYSQLVDSENSMKLRSVKDLKTIFEEAGVPVDTEKKIIISCGSGVSVCHVYLSLEECGRDNSNTWVYDGSWAEWGADPNTPKVTS